MSKIEDQIRKLRDEEARLKRQIRKVEFLNHILASAKEYEHQDFVDVKQDVVQLLSDFVTKTVGAIEAGSEVTVSVGAPTILIAPTQPQVPVQPQVAKQVQSPTIELSPAQKLDFAMQHRELGGKRVAVENDKNLDIKGEVVGLDAPFVVVAVKGGPTIKVPREKIILL